MTPHITERIVYLWFRKRMPAEEIAYLLMVEKSEVLEITSNEARSIEQLRKQHPYQYDWEFDIPA